MISRIRAYARRLLFKYPAGLGVLLRMGKLSKGDYYDCMSEFVMQRVLRDDATCVDIGCHLGDVLEPMLRIAPHGHFYAFEPLPHLFEHLQWRFGGDKRVQLFDLALSDTDGTDRFEHVVDDPAYSGFRRTAAAQLKHAQTIHVTKATLDDVLSGGDIDFIKIDVEGAELQVLRGGEATIRRCRPYVIFEYADHARSYGTSPELIFDFLNGCGLQVNLLDGFLRGDPGFAKDEFIEIVKSEFYFLAHGRGKALAKKA